MSSFDGQLPADKLYRKFLETPDALRADRFSDEDLLCVYDYASDVYDEATQEAVLEIAGRMYPDDEEFLVRRAYYLVPSEDREEIRNIVDELPEGSFHRYILLTRLDMENKEGAREKMFKMLFKASKKSLDDEMVIRFFETIDTEDELDRILDNQQKIEERCMYRDTFLYELAICCNDFHRYERSLAISRTLTSIDPFEAKFWFLQSSIEGYGLSDYESAENDANYALAISPDFDQAKILLAYLTLARGGDYGKAMSSLDGVLGTDVNNNDSLVLGALLALQSGNVMRLADYSERIQASSLDNATKIAFGILFDSNNIDKIKGIKLSDLFLLFTERLPIEMSAEKMIESGEFSHDIIAALLILGSRVGRNDNLAGRLMIAEQLDLAGSYENVIRLVQDNLDSLVSFDIEGLGLLYFYSKAGIATGSKEHVKSDLEFIIKVAKEAEKSSQFFMERMKLRGLISEIEKLYADNY